MDLNEVMVSLRAKLLGNRYHKYTALPDQGSGSRSHHNDGIRPGQNRRALKFGLGLGAALVLIAAISLLLMLGGAMSCRAPGSCFSRGPSHLWGQYSPYFSVRSKISPHRPPGCELTFVQILSRHGSRDPTIRKTGIYDELVRRIQAATTEYGPGYEFLADFNYTLGADELTLLGQRELVESGREARKRYGGLADGDADAVFIRSSGQHRVVQSALNWTQGFFPELNKGSGEEGSGGGGGGGSGDNEATDAARMIVIPEGAGINNTLSHGLCPAFESGIFSELKYRAQKVWADVFVPPLTDRLSRNLRGASLTNEDTVYMMDLCPLTSVARPDGAPTAFCDLFTADEWRSYDYYQSLGKYYGYHAGNPLGPTQGVGFVNELVARLTGTPVQDHTSSNRTLDRAPSTFPLGRRVYADFTHDNVMMTVYGALGLFNSTAGLPLPEGERRAPALAGGFSASWTVPFAARMYVEKMRCRARQVIRGGRGSVGDGDGNGDGDRDENENEEQVRVVLNGRVMPLERCGANSRGMCRLSAFVESLDFAREGGRWEQCFA